MRESAGPWRIGPLTIGRSGRAPRRGDALARAVAAAKLSKSGPLDPGAVRWAAFFDVVGFALTLGALAYARHRLLRFRRDAQEAHQRFTAVVTQSRDWIWQTTPDLVITYSSPGVEHLLGYQPEELIGRSFLDLVPPTEREHLERTRAAAVQGRTGWGRTALQWRHADGHLLTLMGTAEPVFNRAGALIGFRGVRSQLDESAYVQERRAAIKARVRRLLKERALGVALQPIVDMDSGAWLGVEALARFPTGGPEEWFTQAHEAGVGVELECAAVRAALDLLPRLPPRVYLSVNASPSTVLTPTFRAVLEAHAPWLSRIVVELTEHLSVSDYDSLLAALAPARARGLRIAVDDTGAGYSSFLHVIRLRPDLIKLDRALISQLTQDAAKRVVVLAARELSKELGAALVAEGIETDEELGGARSLGVSIMQGFGLAMPSTDPATWSTWAQTDWRATRRQVTSQAVQRSIREPNHSSAASSRRSGRTAPSSS